MEEMQGPVRDGMLETKCDCCRRQKYCLPSTSLLVKKLPMLKEGRKFDDEEKVFPYTGEDLLGKGDPLVERKSKLKKEN